GGHWDNVTPPQLTAWSKVGAIEPSHFDANTAYAAVDRHRLDDRKPYIYRTRDGGKIWTLIVNGIRDGDFVNVVREDPTRKGLLYVGTELGMYVSFDDGDHWQSLQQNLPRTSVRDIDVKNDDLVIATHGRGFWIMDDISALRQMDGRKATTRTRLFKPAAAYRVRTPGFTGTPMPRDEPTAENPPWGAYIDYQLAARPGKPVELSIYDAGGKLVRHYSSADQPKAPDLSKINMTPDWMRVPSALQATPGLHRFVWPLRYAPPVALAEGNPYANGAWAPPGSYTIELKVDGKMFRQPLTVLADPRVHLPQAAFDQQFALAQQVEGLMTKLAAAQQQAGALHKQLQAAHKSASGDLADAIEALDAKVVALAGITETPNHFNAWAMAPAGTGNFHFLDGAIGSLMQAVDGGADAAPSPDARAGYAALSSKLDGVLADWNAIRTGGVSALNARLKAAGHKPVGVAEGNARR
ncbi:MAG TPA: hypothetical protein VF022_00895, partial [Rhodanobacteraceae bacterium]